MSTWVSGWWKLCSEPFVAKAKRLGCMGWEAKLNFMWSKIGFTLNSAEIYWFLTVQIDLVEKWNCSVSEQPNGQKSIQWGRLIHACRRKDFDLKISFFTIIPAEVLLLKRRLELESLAYTFSMGFPSSELWWSPFRGHSNNGVMFRCLKEHSSLRM